VARLADGEAVADVGARHEAQAADERGRAVGQDVAVQVGRHDDVVVRRLPEQLVHHRVDDLLLDLDAGELVRRERLARDLAEQAVRLRQDVGLVRDGHQGLGPGDGVAAGRGDVADLLPAQGDLAGHGGDAGRGALGDALDGLGDLAGGGVGGALLLDVEVLGVLAHDDQVDGRAAAAGGGLDGAHVGVEV